MRTGTVLALGIAFGTSVLASAVGSWLLAALCFVGGVLVLREASVDG